MPAAATIYLGVAKYEQFVISTGLALNTVVVVPSENRHSGFNTSVYLSSRFNSTKKSSNLYTPATDDASEYTLSMRVRVMQGVFCNDDKNKT